MTANEIWLVAYFRSMYCGRVEKRKNRGNQECFLGRAFMEGAIVMGFAFSSRSMLPDGRGQATRSF